MSELKAQDAPEPTKKTEARKRAPKPEPDTQAPVIDETPLLDYLSAAVDDLRQQLRRGGVVVMPGMLQRLFPQDSEKGDRYKVLDWRSFVVYGEWTGAEWDVVVYDGAQLRKTD